MKRKEKLNDKEISEFPINFEHTLEYALVYDRTNKETKFKEIDSLVLQSI